MSQNIEDNFLRVKLLLVRIMAKFGGTKNSSKCYMCRHGWWLQECVHFVTVHWPVSLQLVLFYGCSTSIKKLIFLKGKTLPPIIPFAYLNLLTQIQIFLFSFIIYRKKVTFIECTLYSWQHKLGLVFLWPKIFGFRTWSLKRKKILTCQFSPPHISVVNNNLEEKNVTE